MNDELNKATTTPDAPDALTDEQIENVNGGAGNAGMNVINRNLSSANVTASAKNNLTSVSRRIRVLI